VAGLQDLGFIQSAVDPCVLYRGNCVFLCWVDDTILCCPTTEELDAIVQLLGTKFDVSDEGELSDYLGVKIENLDDGKIKMSQPQLIQQILDDLGLQGNSKEHSTPARPDHLVLRDPEGPDFDEHFNYRSVIGKLNFLEKSTRPDIAFAVHQCARYSSNPKKSHGEAVKRIGRYLKATKDEGIIFNPASPEDTTFDCWADASFAGDWYKHDAMDNPLTAKSRSGYILLYAGCPLIWASKIQTEITLSSTESEYVCLSQSLREVIPMMQLLDEIRERGIPMQAVVPKVHCTLFEDNVGALEMAKTPKMRPRRSTSILSIITFVSTFVTVAWCYNKSILMISWRIFSPNHYRKIFSFIFGS
jgi:hypothetical protein